jgi:photosystem II stability/assembly factor-like uncharacterized protein
MHHTQNSQRGLSRWQALISVAGAGLLCLLLAIALLPSPVAAQGAVICVAPTGDYPTIQEAIAAANDGDEIRVAGGDYFEQLVITRSLQLSGHWDDDCASQDNDTLTVVDAAGGGRAATILSVTITPTVMISNFRFLHGDASGLGGVITPTVPNAPAPAAVRASAAPVSDLATMRAGLVELAAQGAFPGGEAALAELLARHDSLMATHSEATHAASAAPVVVAAADGEIDCGGGIYADGVQLRLYDVRIFESTASATRGGAGGGLCVVNPPAGGLALEAVVLGLNVASTAGNGYGGGLFVSAAQPVSGALSLHEVSLRENQATTNGNGYGGGAFVQNMPGMRATLAVFTSNTATANGRIGFGGGLYLEASPGVTLETVGFQLNTASTSLTVPDPTVDWNTGFGGGLYVNNSPDLTLRSIPSDEEPASLLIANVAALKGLGRGGGAYLENSPNAHVEGVGFLGNYAAVYPAGLGETVAGGAVHLVGSPGARLVDNDFNQNIAGVFSLEDFKLLGGAVDIEVSDHVLVQGNRFLENTTGTSAAPGNGNGGALEIGYSDAITVSENLFTGNIADLGLRGGLAGAVHAVASNDLLIHHNTFERNRAGATLGIGGALVVEGASGQKSNFIAPQGVEDKLNERVTISANTFRDNRAALDLTGDQALLGGALAINSTNGLRLVNNLFANNQARVGAAAALLGWDVAKIPPVIVRDAQIVNNTLAANAGENGLYLEMWQTPITLTNNIIVSHTVGIHVETGQTLGMAAEVRYTVYNDNATNSDVTPDSTLIETGAITAPVEFVSFLGGDYRLLPTSAAIDAGDPAGVPPAPAVDIEGTPRPFGWAVDIGAYEWHGPQLFLPWIAKPVCPPLDYVGWAAGMGEQEGQTIGAILHTTDGGATWQEQLSTPGVEYFGVKAVDARNAWVTGTPGRILRTRDGGQQWEQQSLPSGVPVDLMMGAITAVDGQHAWTSGIAPDKTVYRMHTTDGATWQVTPVDSSLPITLPFQDMSAADASHVYAVGTLQAPGNDRAAGVVGFFDGQKWTRQGAGVFKNIDGSTGIALIGVNALNASTAWVVGGGETPVYKTIDGGATWFTDNQAYITFGDSNTIVMADATHGWLAGDHGALLHTTNGWATYEAQTASPQTFSSITAMDANTAWATTYAQNLLRSSTDSEVRGDIVRTCDAGKSWERHTLAISQEMITISFVGARR